MLEIITNILYYVGIYSPGILFAISCFLLRNKSTLMSVYIIGSVCNFLLNIILKLAIRQPRPSEDAKLFAIALQQGKPIKFDQYGMPSGHAENAFYSIVFMFMALKDIKITAMYAVIALITLYQRGNFPT